MKRKKPDSSSISKSDTPKKRRIDIHKNDQSNTLPAVDETPQATPSRRGRFKEHRAVTDAVLVPNGLPNGLHNGLHNGQLEDEDSGSPTPKANGDATLRTPRKSPSRSKRADRSAKRKSASALLQREDEEDWDGENALAQEILEEEDDELGDAAMIEEVNQDADGQAILGQAETPSKKGRGRPKGSKNRRSPTPEGDIPPEERYFFQNRSGPPHVSNNTLASLKLLRHEEYFEQIRKYTDHHKAEKTHLMKLHARSFLQWQFELNRGFNICLYGWGSKRQLVNKFAEWLYPKHHPPPKIVMVNGYTPKLSVRALLSTLSTAVMSGSATTRLVGQPNEILDTLLSHLTTHPPSSPLIFMINSIDAISLRRPATQSLLARLAAHPCINVVATADTPSFPLIWNTTLHNQFRFVFHDCTTYAPYDVELSVVDDVHDLLGRKSRRVGGKEGVGFVLKSLPENARNLYRVLLTEILAVFVDGLNDETAKQQEKEGDAPPVSSKGLASDGEIGIDLRLLFQKASEEFICSSEMSFRTLLKEFHDHEMIVSRRDASGTEVLGVPLGREDMEGVLEDLVME